MYQYYKDILDRIAEQPTWFDDYGVPRFGDFSPEDLGNIYASEAALAEVSCQGCGRMFKGALTEVFASKSLGLNDEIRLSRVDYGDPPNVYCCGAGPTMSSVMHRILEYWSRDYEASMNWQRDTTFEGPIAEEPVDPPDTIAEVLAAVGSGVQSIRIMCTSRRNRCDLAGRITTEMVRTGRVLVTYHESYVSLAHQMIEGLVPSADVGHWKEERKVTLVEFSRLKDIPLSTISCHHSGGTGSDGRRYAKDL
ncbi:hypothetical protein NXC12_CH00295 [Rhizobium etli]|uniref:Uncharacterized protein n=1 Tax=Rhizobium etli TaxID=29449 RepID=A0AAN1BCG5_RHIET|nr:hypothetical protein [Rhizobium etli]ARQ08391.1 hypothetical protein NXC12_CH00295 [Rhizobium etli]